MKFNNFQFSIFNKKSGFTLIESLVVVTMMMVVIAIGVTSYSAANKKNRDNKRLADLDKIRMALEMYRQSDSGAIYPANAEDDLVPNYLDQWPDDPSSNRIYVYERLTDFTYRLGALTEFGATNGVPFGNCSVGEAENECNYVVTNP